ncbi:uncharacterized protein LOC120904838 [Anopheles arabiensis]|uniref:uncharacterized protein LOC120903726 n=1 Tax=Anopheles arabiensis TaxID=7173 RepID=UPI001AADCB10|nr:uncharacterized protein LOC120903726 [Anopheles arabiensis]XP_040171185.1 uncharacterized protein LOC120904838 [Anopheles arabiensis]
MDTGSPAGFVLALSLRFFINRLQYAIMCSNWEYDDHLLNQGLTAGDALATATSKRVSFSIPVGSRGSDVGHSLEGSASQAGPEIQMLLFIKSGAVMPRETRSAGFCCPGIWSCFDPM